MLKETPAEFSLDGPGSISSKGEFTAAEGKAHTATIVTAKAGELTGKVRIRVVPMLPWKFDFEGLKDAPVTWVGARYRHVMRQVDGHAGKGMPFVGVGNVMGEKVAQVFLGMQSPERQGQGQQGEGPLRHQPGETVAFGAWASGAA